LYRAFFPIACCWLLASCVSQQELTYFNESQQADFDNYLTQDYRLRPYDLVYINLDALEGENLNAANLFGAQQGNQMVQANQAMFYVQGYKVAEDGSIELPYLGKVQAAGKTTAEMGALLNEALKPYLKFTSIKVTLSNFRVTVLGEVARPGVQYTYDTKLTVLQALATAGDFTQFANRKSIRLIRESEEGTEMVTLNLQDPKTLASEYFFLLPNDVLIVDPNKARPFTVNSRAASLTISIVSVLTLITNILFLR